MITLSDYISESILSSTRTGKAGLEDEMRRYGLDPAKVTFNADGTIDYDGTVKMNNRGLTKLPFKFRNVNGMFYCGGNELTTLEGCPETVTENFACNFNKLVNLKGGPKQVGGHYYCYDNELTSLEGLPKKLDKNLYCQGNKVKFTEEDVLKICKMNRNRIYV